MYCLITKEGRWSQIVGKSIVSSDFARYFLTFSPLSSLFLKKKIIFWNRRRELTGYFTFVFHSNSADEITHMYCIPQVSCTNKCISSVYSRYPKWNELTHVAVNSAQGFTCPVLALSKSSMSMYEHLNEPWPERWSTFFNQEYHLRQHGNWNITMFILLFPAGFIDSICTKSHSDFLTALWISPEGKQDLCCGHLYSSLVGFAFWTLLPYLGIGQQYALFWN